jgi:hypothetical protein
MDCFYMALPALLLEMLPTFVARVTPTVVQMSWPEMAEETAFLSVLFPALKTDPNFLLFLLMLVGFYAVNLLVGVFLHFLFSDMIRTALGRLINTLRWPFSFGSASKRTPLLIVTKRNYCVDGVVTSLPFPFQGPLDRNCQYSFDSRGWNRMTIIIIIIHCGARIIVIRSDSARKLSIDVSNGPFPAILLPYDFLLLILGPLMSVVDLTFCVL